MSTSVQFRSVTQSCPTLCDPMNRSTPGLPVHHKLPEFTQIHVHWVGDAIQPSHPLSSSSPPAPNPSQHQGLFQWVSSSHEVAKVLEFQLQHQSFQWTPPFPPNALQAPVSRKCHERPCVSVTRQLCAAPPVDAVCPHPVPSHGSAQHGCYPFYEGVFSVSRPPQSPVCPSSWPLLLSPLLDLLLCLPCSCESAGQPRDLRLLHTHSQGKPVTRQTQLLTASKSVPERERQVLVAKKPAFS